MCDVPILPGRCVHAGKSTLNYSILLYKTGVVVYKTRAGSSQLSIPGAFMSYQHIKVPAGGQKITVNADFSLNVPDEPIIPYYECDGTGADITPVMLKVVDAAVA